MAIEGGQNPDAAAPGGDARAIEDFLEAPKRKKKTFIVLAFSKMFNPDIAANIQSFFKTNYKKLALTQPKMPQDFNRLVNRQIQLVIYDDEFAPLEEGLRALHDLKTRKRDGPVPVLFLTRNKDELIKAYNKILLPFHETDEYLYYPRAPINQIYNRIKAGLEAFNRRSSRRYVVDAPITYYLLSQDKTFKGTLLDLSMHGALLQSEDNQIFRTAEQLKLNIPVSRFINPLEGEFLKLSCRVRRVLISGNKVGVSFEYVTEKQQLMLVQFLTEMVNSQMARQSQAMLNKMANAE